MGRMAVTSFVPGVRYWDFHWPERGTIDRTAVVKGLPDPTLMQVLSIPCQCPAKLHFQDHARWAILEIDDRDFVEQEEGVVDFQRGEVVFSGSPQDACAFLAERGLPVPSSVLLKSASDWEEVEVGTHGIAIAGWDSTARAGKYGIAFVANGTAQAGDSGVAVSNFGEVEAGKRGFAIAIRGRSAIAGDGGVAITDEYGHAVAGANGVSICDSGRSEVGDHGMAISYRFGAAIGGNGALAFSWNDNASPRRGTMQAGVQGILVGQWHDGHRDRIAVAYVGENDILPNVPYVVDASGRFVLATSEDGPLG
jgi:hypothetical protein